MKFFLINLLSIHLFALQSSVDYSTYEEAEKTKNTQLEFIVTSTKVGIFKSYVHGYVKKFTYKADRKNNELSNMQIEFPVEAMTTDHDARDEKLHNLCMSKDKYPKLLMKVNEPLKLQDGLPQELSGTVMIRGKEKPFTIKAVFTKGLLVIHSKWSLKEMEIPDPSIAVATLGDEINIKAQFELAKDL